MVGHPAARPRHALRALVVVLALVAAACGGDGDGGGGQAPAAGGDSSFEKRCGLGNGQKASGEPLKVGAVMTASGGIDFSSSVDAASAFFECVNANGGINGRPIQYVVYDDALSTEKASQLAAKLVEDDRVAAIVGSSSFVDCVANAKYYEQQGLKVIYGVGVPEECFSTPAIAATNAGPRISAVGTVQYAVEQLGAKRIVVIGIDTPNNGRWLADGVDAYARSVGVESTRILVLPPIRDAQAIVLDAVSKGDTVALAMPAPEDVAVLKAAEAQGLIDRVKWICLTPCLDESFPKAVGDAWNDKVHINSELTLVDADTPDNQLWRQVMDKYGSRQDPRDTFSQAGFLAAKIFVDTALKQDAGSLNRAGLSKAIGEIKNYRSDILCKPWYWGPEAGRHNANNTDREAVLRDGRFEVVKDCYDVADPALTELRRYEQRAGLNTGA